MVKRQGDVYFEAVKKQRLEKATEVKKLTVAYGEVTGHHHTILPVEEGTVIKQMQDKDGSFLVEVTGGRFGIFHGNDEQVAQVYSGKQLDWVKEDVHAPQYFEPGVYRFWKQTEYDVETYRREVLD